MKSMKHWVISTILLGLFFITASAQNPGGFIHIKFPPRPTVVTDGIKSSRIKPTPRPIVTPKKYKKRINGGSLEIVEKNISRLFSAFDLAFQNNNGLSLNDIPMTKEAREGLDDLWVMEHFTSREDSLGFYVQVTYNGYQVRDIPLYVVHKDENGQWVETEYKEAVVDFNKKGEIISFKYCIDPEIYGKLAKDWVDQNNNPVKDVKERMLVHGFVEQFRTAYNQRDIKFMENIFSDDALIITGTVVKKQKPQMTDAPKARMSFDTTYVYKQERKDDYLKKLKRIFDDRSYINVTFEDEVVSKHQKKDVYYVRVKQYWNSVDKKGKPYNDQGVVYIIWDFRKSDPQILVRAWQDINTPKEKLLGRKNFIISDK